MSIINHEALTKYIASWVGSYAFGCGRTTLVVGLSGGIDSALVSLLCQKTGLNTFCVILPCHSSSESTLRAEAFAKTYNLNCVKVNLTPAFDSIHGFAISQGFPGLNGNKATRPVVMGGLKSCLRAPTLSFYANATDGLIVGTGNRSEDRLVRYFQKFGDGCVDLCPIADLFKSEVYELFDYLAKVDGKLPDAAKAIFDAKPSADLWGPDAGQEDEKELGMTYDELEWVDREDCNNQIIVQTTIPVEHKDWPRYTLRQKELIGKVWSMEKKSKHKENYNLPVCHVRSPGFVR